MMLKKTIGLTESSWAILAVTRFLLATIVAVGHLHVFTELPPVLDVVMKLGGKAAVIGFLLISGLSIGHSYAKSTDGYFQRRFLRIYPLYFFAVLIPVLLQYFLQSPYELPNQTLGHAGWLTSVANFLFLQGFASITITYNGPLWSLAIEVFFYLLVPFLMKIPIKWFYFILLASMAAFAFFPAKFFFGYIALVYGWPWLLGFLISTRKSHKFILPLFLLGAASIVFNKNIRAEELSWITFSIIPVIVIISLYITWEIPEFIRNIFNYAGEISYPLYVFHMPFFLILYHLGVRNAWEFCILLLIMVIPANYLFDHWLKQIFWKPLVSWITVNFSQYRIGLSKVSQNLFQSEKPL